jgi:hypothetical protein
MYENDIIWWCFVGSYETDPPVVRIYVLFTVYEMLRLLGGDATYIQIYTYIFKYIYVHTYLGESQVVYETIRFLVMSIYIYIYIYIYIHI